MNKKEAIKDAKLKPIKDKILEILENNLVGGIYPDENEVGVIYEEDLNEVANELFTYIEELVKNQKSDDKKRSNPGCKTEKKDVS